MKTQISVTILAKNSSETIEETLISTIGFPEVLVLDTGSTDATIEICSRYPHVKIFSHPFEGFGPTHNIASSLARFPWILSLDSDEVLTPKLKNEILSLSLDSRSVYRIRRHNFFRKKRITTCSGWDPDWVVRLYDKTQTRFSNDQVHEKILTSGMNIVSLIHPMTHTPYRKISDFLHKMQSYSNLFADQNVGRREASLLKALLHGWLAFVKSYIFKRGIFQGSEGFIISLYNSHTTFYKYLKLSEKK